MNIIDAYQYYSDDIISQDETLNRYEKDLNKKSKYISNLLISTNLFTKLLHPIKLIRTQQEEKRIKQIQKTYIELKKSCILEHIDEEDGDLEYDLNAAATHFKPDRMKLYAKRNPVYREQDKKLLQKKR